MAIAIATAEYLSDAELEHLRKFNRKLPAQRHHRNLR